MPFISFVSLNIFHQSPFTICSVHHLKHRAVCELRHLVFCLVSAWNLFFIWKLCTFLKLYLRQLLLNNTITDFHYILDQIGLMVWKIGRTLKSFFHTFYDTRITLSKPYLLHWNLSNQEITQPWIWNPNLIFLTVTVNSEILFTCTTFTVQYLFMEIYHIGMSFLHLWVRSWSPGKCIHIPSVFSPNVL